MITESKLVLGLDIGEKYNGVAVAEYDTGKLVTTEICDAARLIAQLETLDPERVAVVGIEQFLLYAWNAQAKSWSTFRNIELIGVAKYLLSQQGIPYVEVKAVESKHVYSKKRLKEMGYDIRFDPKDHKRDALSVALYAADRLRTNSKRVVVRSYGETFASI